MSKDEEGWDCSGKPLTHSQDEMSRLLRLDHAVREYLASTAVDGALSYVVAKWRSEMERLVGEIGEDE